MPHPLWLPATPVEFAIEAIIRGGLGLASGVIAARLLAAGGKPRFLLAILLAVLLAALWWAVDDDSAFGSAWSRHDLVDALDASVLLLSAFALTATVVLNKTLGRTRPVASS